MKMQKTILPSRRAIIGIILGIGTAHATSEKASRQMDDQ
jgi:hypothetical protein